MKTLSTLKLSGKRVFVRCDFNVPLANGKITDMLRIEQAIPTIEYILGKKAKQIILASHLGRPDGPQAEYSLKPVAAALEKLLGEAVHLHEDLLEAPPVDKKVILLENLRFYDAEQTGSESFAKQLASFADVYVNDAFGTAHRKDASVYALAKLLPRAGGLLMEKEVTNVHLNHRKPITAIFGPAKIADKLPVLTELLRKVDKVILGGGVVFTFLKAADVEIGKSLVEEEMVPTAKELLDKYSKKLVFPVDFVAAAPSSIKRFAKLSPSEKRTLLKSVPVEKIPKTLACYDVGPKSVKLFKAVLGRTKTVVWNGPLGMFEVRPFDKSTTELLKFITEKKITCIVGGGDTATAARQTKYADKLTHISTGGGASLELLAGKQLPALQVLKK